MANKPNLFLSTAGLFYESISNALLMGQTGIDSFLFGNTDMSDSSEFRLDRLLTNPAGVVFRQKDSESHVRPYTPGSGIYYEIPRASEKTPVTESLRDSVIVGASNDESFAGNDAELFRQIVRDHTLGHMVTRWKLALDTLRTGVFSPLALGGVSIPSLQIDFERDSSLNKTYNFAAAGAKIDIALKELFEAYRAQGGTLNNICVLLGASWQAALENDSTVMQRMATNSANELITLNMMPPNMNNTAGLYVIGRYRIPGTLAPIWLLGFAPDGKFIPSLDATPQDYFPSNEAILFSTTDTRYRVFRGIDARGDGRELIRTVGEVVFDSYTSDDPPAYFVRSQARVAFIPGDVNKTARSVGTFA